MKTEINNLKIGDIGSNFIDITTDKNEIVCTIQDSSGIGFSRKEQAEFIVKACNSYAEMLEALKEMNRILSFWDNTSVAINKLKAISKDAIENATK